MTLRVFGRSARLWLACALVTLAGCTVRQAEDKPVTGQENQDSEDRIFFVNYTIFPEEGDGVRAVVTQKLLTYGTLKRSNRRAEPLRDTDLICYQLDARNLRLDSLRLHNPLYAQVEYTAENQELATIERQMDSADLMVRLPLHPRARQVILRQAGNRKMTLATIDL